MSKAQQDQLVQLIGSMTKAEKRHFKLYCGRNSRGQDALFVKLFSAIERHGSYEEGIILRKVSGLKRSQLANTRSHLYKQLLTSLRLLRRQHSEEMAIRDQFDFAEILYAKGLYRQSLNMLHRAKASALSLSLYPLAMDIISFEKLIESQYITRSIDTTAEELSAQSTQIARQVQMESAYSNLSLQLYGLYLRIGHAKNADELSEVREFFGSHMPPYDEAELSFFARLHLYQSYVWFFYITQGFSRQYRFAQKAVELFHGSPDQIANNTPLYLKSLHNLLNTLFLTLQYEKFCETFTVLDTFNHDERYQLTANESSLHLQFVYVHRINKHFMEGSFSAGLRWIGELEELLESNKPGWDEHRILIFYYKIACLYFGAGHNGASIEFLNKIIQPVSQDFGEDIQCFARILNLIANYEMGNAELMPYQIRSVYRYLLKIRELNATHETILKFLRTTPNIQRDQLPEAFAELTEKLLAIQNRRFEKRSSLYLDIISWLESKVLGIPVQQVIRKKFEERHAVSARR